MSFYILQIYWYDDNPNRLKRKIYRQTYENIFTDTQPVTETDVIYICEWHNYITSISVDWVTGNLYFTEARYTSSNQYSGIVGVIATKPGQVNIARVLVSDRDRIATAITLDPTGGIMYYALNGTRPMIYSANMTGTVSDGKHRRNVNVYRATCYRCKSCCYVHISK